MGFFSEIKSALNEIFAEFSQDVKFRGKAYKCIIGENGQQEVELESGGFVPNETFTVKFKEAGGFVPNETFTVKFKEADLEDEAYPSIGELLQYSGRTFRIHWISTRSKRGQIEIWIRSVDK